MKRKMEKERKADPKRRRNKNLTMEEKINSSLLYTPDLYVWTNQNNSKE